MLISAYVNGATVGSPPPPRDHSQDAKRGEVNGWTAGSVRRHTKWLYSISTADLTGEAVAFTFTVRSLPPGPEDWKRVRERFWKRVRDAGMLRRGHWLTEWQRRMCPHLHGIVYLPDDWEPPEPWAKFGRLRAAELMLLRFWLESADEFEPAMHSQSVALVDGVVGWLRYLSKHAARGVRHYQRWGSPETWTKTGRLWGYLGEWPVVEPQRFDMEPDAYFRFRRLARGRRIADARAALVASARYSGPEGQKRRSVALARLIHARGMLRCSDRRLSPVRGLSDWMPEDVTLTLLGLLVSEGYEIVERVEVVDHG